MTQNKKIILTYGTFDLFHVGHLNILNNLKKLGDYLIVGVSTDEFNQLKGKKTIINFHDRLKIVQNIKSVDLAIPESCWSQKASDIIEYNVNVFGMGHDWEGKFDDLKNLCEVIYLPRTENVSSTEIKESLKALNKKSINDLKKALDVISNIVTRLD